MRETIHDREVRERAMARLARVHGHRTESAQVPGLSMVASARPRDAEDFTDSGSYWTCAFFLERAGQSRNPPPDLVTRYSMGSAHREPPKCDDVFYCLASDATSYDGTHNFEEWAADFGYDTDSRKAERAYRIIAEQAKALRAMLGKDYEAVVERGAREWAAE